LNKQ